MSAGNKFPFDKKIVFILALLPCLLWGSAFPAVKTGYALLQIGAEDTAGQLLFAGYRFTGAGLLLLLFCPLSGRNILDLHGTDFFRLALLGLIMTTLQYIFFYIGLARVSGVAGSILTGTSTFFAVLLAHLVFRNEHLTRRVALGCLAGFAGVISVNLGRGPLELGFSLKGEGFMVLAALCGAAGGVYGKIVSRVVDSVVMTGWQLVFGGSVLVILGWLGGGAVSGFSPSSGMLMLYLSLLSSAAFALNASLLKHHPVSLITVFQFTVPIFGAALSALFLGDRLWEWKNLMALVLVCLGIYLVSTRKPEG